MAGKGKGTWLSPAPSSCLRVVFRRPNGVGGVHGSVRAVSVVERAPDPEVKRRGFSLLCDLKHFLAPTGLRCYL